MSNDTDFTLRFRHKSKRYLEQVKRRCAEKKDHYDRHKATGENLKVLMRQVGAKKRNEVVTWGFEFEKIRKDGDGYCLPATAWANQNVNNLHVTGEDGELADLLAHFPELEIEGEYVDEYGRGSVCQADQEFEESLEDDVIEAAFDSSFISDMRYDPETEELEVNFTSGRSFTYSGVPREIAIEFSEASSPGSYFNSSIKGVYD